MRVWEFSTSRVLGVLEGHSSIVNSVDISRDGKYLVTGVEMTL